MQYEQMLERVRNGDGFIAALDQSGGSTPKALKGYGIEEGAWVQLPDGVQVLSSGALRGLKDTRVPMLITILAYWGIGLPLGAWFGLHLHGRAPGLWVGLILGLSVAGSLLAWRLWLQCRDPKPMVPVT